MMHASDLEHAPDGQGSAHSETTNDPSKSVGSPRQQVPTLDDLLPVKKHLAPSWGDSVSVRAIRGYIATHGFFAGHHGEMRRMHDWETTVTLREAPDCRVVVFLPRNPAASLSSMEKSQSSGNSDAKDDTDGRTSVESKGVVVHFHGGGWSICKPEMEAALCRHLSDTLDCVVVAPDYAKAPEHYFPHALRQAHGVLNWVAAPVEQASLSKYLKEQQSLHRIKPVTTINSQKIALTGGSSGGNVAAAVTLLAAKIPLDHDARIRALGLQYPGLDLATPYDDKFNSLSDKGAICPPPWASKLFLRCFLPRPYDTEEQRASPWISPGRASDNDLRSFPPTQIVTAQNDHYRVESQNFAKRLESLGVPVAIRVIDEFAHAFDLVPVEAARRDLQEKARMESWTLLSQHLRRYI